MEWSGLGEASLLNIPVSSGLEQAPQNSENNCPKRRKTLKSNRREGKEKPAWLHSPGYHNTENPTTNGPVRCSPSMGIGCEEYHRLLL